MEIIKRTLAALVMLCVVILVWVGFYIYFESTNIDIDSNAENYIKQLKSNFDLEELKEISEKVENNFPVAPEVFLSLVD
jgi:hypothetical protein